VNCTGNTMNDLFVDREVHIEDGKPL
jgi:hypothetical protein